MDATVGALPATGPRFAPLRLVAFGLALLFGVQAAPVPAGAAMQFVAGTCAMTLRVTKVSATTLEIRTPAPGGTCVLASEEETVGKAWLEGNVFRVSPLAVFSCEKLVAKSDNGALFIDGDNGTAWGGFDGDMVVTAEAGVVEISLVVGTRLAAAGTFAQTTPNIVQSCGNWDAVTQWEWQGALVFEDPVIE